MIRDNLQTRWIILAQRHDEPGWRGAEPAEGPPCDWSRGGAEEEQRLLAAKQEASPGGEGTKRQGCNQDGRCSRHASSHFGSPLSLVFIFLIVRKTVSSCHNVLFVCLLIEEHHKMNSGCPSPLASPTPLQKTSFPIF